MDKNRMNQVSGLSGIAFAPAMMAGFVCVIAGFINLPRMWRLSALMAVLFVPCILAAGLGLMFAAVFAYRKSPGVPGGVAMVVGAGITGYEIFLVISGTDGMGAGGLFMHVLGPPAAGIILLAVRGALFAGLAKSGNKALADKLEWI